MVVYASLDDSVNSRSFSMEDLLVVEVLKDLWMYFHGVLKMLLAVTRYVIFEVAQTRI